MYAIYVNQTRYVPYADAIVNGYKKIETRSRNVLGKLVGKKVMVVRTMQGKPSEVVGYVRISGAEFWTAAEMDERRNETLIPPGSKFDCRGKGKWCYSLTEAEAIKPFKLPKHGAVNHGRSYCEILI